MRDESTERPDRISRPAVGRNNDPSARPVYSSIDSAPAISTRIDNPCGSVIMSPWRGRTAVEMLSSWDESHSVSSSIRSTRRRRGGDVSSGAAAEGKDWAQALTDLEQMRKENYELLQESLRGDRYEMTSPADEAFAGSRLGSSARSSVRRRRRGMVAGVTAGGVEGASRAQEDTCIGTSLLERPIATFSDVGASAVVSSLGKEARSAEAGGNSGHMKERFTCPPPPTMDPSAIKDQQDLSVQRAPQHTSGLPQSLKRPTSEERPEAAGNALPNGSVAAKAVVPEVRGGGRVSWSANTFSRAHSPSVGVSARTTNEVIASASLVAPSSHVDPQKCSSSLPLRSGHRDPAGADALSAPRGSRSRSHAASPSKAAPTSKPLPFSSGASQPPTQTRLERSMSGIAAVAKDNAPTSAPTGSTRFSSVSRKPAAPPMLSVSLVPTAARSAAAVTEAPSGSPESQPRLRSAESEAGRLLTMGSSKARGSSMAAAFAKPESFHSTLDTRNASVPRTRRVVPGRVSSVLRSACRVRQNNTIARDAVTDGAQSGVESQTVPCAVACVHRERTHPSVSRPSREGCTSGSSQTKGGDTTRPGAGSLLHRATVLTVLRRQEVMRNRLAREHKAIEESRARLSAVKQLAASRVNIVSSRGVEESIPCRDIGSSLEIRLSSLQVTSEHVSKARRRASAEARLVVSPKRATVVRPSLAASSVLHDSQQLRRQNTSHTDAQQCGDSLWDTSPNIHLAPATLLPTFNARALAASRNGSVPGGGLRGGVSHTGSVALVYQQTHSENVFLSRALTHPQSAAARKGSAAAASPSSSSSKRRGTLQQAESKASVMAVAPQPASKERVGLSSAMAEKSSSLLVPTGSAAAATTSRKSPQLSVPHGAAVIPGPATGQLRAMPFCVECGQRHIDNLAKFCALCGHKRAFLPW